MINILSKIFAINCIQVIGVFHDTNEERYTLLTFKKEKNKLNILENKTFSTQELLFENINTKLPVILSIDGKGVLNKKIDIANEVDIAWKKNVDYKTIYHTSYQIKNNTFMSFCRKSVIDDWFAIFETKKIEVIDIYVGSFLSVLLANNLNESKIISGNLVLELEQNELVGFLKTEINSLTNYTVSNAIITSDALPLYGIALHYFTQSESISKSKLNSNSIEEVIYRKVFNFFGLLMLVGFFISLLISYFAIQYYSGKNAELNIKNVYSNKSYQKIVTLEKQKEDKEKIIKDSGFLSNKFLTFYSYEIIKSVPNSVSLNELNIAPLLKDVKSNEKVEVSAGIILVKGATINEEDFNDWLRTIKTFEWVEKFEIESLKKDKNNNTLFSLKISVK